MLKKHEIRFAITGVQQSFKISQLVEFRGRPIIIGARGAYIWGDYKLRCFSCLQVDGRCPLTKGAYKGQFRATVLKKAK